MKVVKILTPASSLQIIEKNLDELKTSQLNALRSSFANNSEILNLLSSEVAFEVIDNYDRTENPINSEANSPMSPVRMNVIPSDVCPKRSLTQFEITKVNLRVRDCLLVYCCQPGVEYCQDSDGARCILSIGSLTVSTNIVSNVSQHNIKFSIVDLALHVSNELAKSSFHIQKSVKPSHVSGEYKHVPAVESKHFNAMAKDVDLHQFLNSNDFIQLLIVDRNEVILTSNDGSGEVFSLEVALNVCSINACTDSLELFTVILFLKRKIMNLNTMRIISENTSAVVC